LNQRAAEAAHSMQVALSKVQRLTQELDHCMQQLKMIDGSTSDSVARHPAFRRMRASVQQKMESLKAQLGEARAVYEDCVKTSEETTLAVKDFQEEQQEGTDLTPLLKDALDNLWQRPYDCRVFTLQLLQALAELDDRSVCMMSSCFARYLETHSAPAGAPER